MSRSMRRQFLIAKQSVMLVSALAVTGLHGSSSSLTSGGMSPWLPIKIFILRITQHLRELGVSAIVRQNQNHR